MVGAGNGANAVPDCPSEKAFGGKVHSFMAILHFFCDESGKYQKNHFVSVAGVGAPKQRIEPFDLRWRELLRSYQIEELRTAQLLDLTRNSGTRILVGQTLEERQ